MPLFKILTHIPKIPNPVESEDFRPISLIGYMYKLQSKILDNRLRKALPSIISPMKRAFVHGRQILDGVLMANELIDSRKRMKKEGVIFKIDMEKVYDHVEWGFIDYMLGRFGFGVTWRLKINLAKSVLVLIVVWSCFSLWLGISLV